VLETCDVHGRRNHLDIQTIVLENDVQDDLAVNVGTLHLHQLLSMGMFMHLCGTESCCNEQRKRDQGES